MSKRRVVVTGMGVVTPIGIGVDEFWKALLEGKNGVDLITKFDASRFDTKFAAEVKNFYPENYLDKKTIRRLDLYAQYAMVSAIEILENGTIDLNKINLERFGVIYGSGIGGINTLQDQFEKYFHSRDPHSFSPFFVPMMISDIAAGHISIHFGLKGPNYATTSACATASHAISDAFMLIQRGSADLMICGGSEASITEISIGG